MTGEYGGTDGGIGPEAGARVGDGADVGAGADVSAAVDDALRSGLRGRADLLTITAPPIAVVRRRALRRRRRRSVVQGAVGLGATCAVVAGIVAWSPGRDARSGGSVTSGGVARASSASSSAPSPLSSPSHTSRTISAAGFLQASDLGSGWKGPIGRPSSRTELSLAGSGCEGTGVYRAQVPVTPAVNRYFEQYSPSGSRTNEAWEAIYIFAPGTGPTVMSSVRTALATGCGAPQLKVLAYPSTAGDEAIVFTVDGGTRNLLVRSGDLVASALVNTVPSGQDGAAAMDELAKLMATRLMTG